jgi:hypothetical protein
MKAGARMVRRKRPGSARRVSEGRLKKFLHDVVNADENNFDYILHVYADAGFLPSKTISERAFGASLTPEELIPRRHRERRQALDELREGLRRILSADDDDTAQWRLFSLQNKIYRSADPAMYESGARSCTLLQAIGSCIRPLVVCDGPCTC